MNAFQGTLVQTASGRALLQLRTALHEGPLSQPLTLGRVPVAGIQLVSHDAATADIREMSLAELVLDAAAGGEWLGIPVFTSRRIFHSMLAVAETATIRRPQDLVGRKVGGSASGNDATIWTRGILHDQFGVGPQDVQWSFDAEPERLAEAVTQGGLDAAVLPGPFAGCRPLFADPRAEAARYFTETGLYPIASVLAVRRNIYDAYPWVALNLFSAFLKAADVAREEVQPWLDTFYEAGLVDQPARSLLPASPLRHGLKAPREIEMLLSYAAAQGVLHKPMKIADIFAHDTLDV